jgi:hypothetical protein
MGFGELFQKNRIKFGTQKIDNTSRSLLWLRDNHPASFLDNFIFSTYSEITKAVGFKMFIQQLRRDRYKPVLDWLLKNRHIKILYLRRENLLAAYASRLKAAETGIFGTKDTTAKSRVRIQLDFEKCVKEFTHRRNLDSWAFRQFKNFRTHSLMYEDLVKSREQAIKAILNFLEVPTVPLETKSIKLETRPLSEVIINFEELRERFRGTEWGSFFEAP